MTTGCSHSKRSSRSQDFLFNPYELAITGPDGSGRKALVDRLLSDYLSRTSVFVARKDEVIADGDAYLAPQRAIDADIALIERDTNVDAPTIAWIESDAPNDLTGVIAYVGPGSACPILPADATYFTDDDVAGLATFIFTYFDEKAKATPLYGLVLTGGQSSRMGRDKAALDYHGKPQAKHAVDLLAGFCSKVYVSTRPGQENADVIDDLPQIQDSFLGFGPLGGILSALKTEPQAAWMVLACDLPYVTHETLAHLAKHRNPFKLATAYRNAANGFPEPLIAVYEPKSVHRLLRFLGLGYHCPRKVLINSDTHLLDAPDPQQLENVNHPEEYEAARDAIAKGQEPVKP